jgi:jumonji domain-containing protein 7
VVARPATRELRLKDFLAWTEALAATNTSTSLYVEYLSLRGYLPKLLKDLPPAGLPFASFLPVEVTNLWFGDGHTRGKLHFDAYENHLVMVAGSKTFTLFHPYNNSQLYEGHVREGVLEAEVAQHCLRDSQAAASWAAGGEPAPTDEPFDAAWFARCIVFRRRKARLSEATSIVNTPVDLNLPLSSPHMEPFPEFRHAAARVVTCHVEEGEVLYLPSYWWHEVQSHPQSNVVSDTNNPNTSRGHHNTKGGGDVVTTARNIAINYWYTPLLQKPFPCADCGFELSPHYVQAAALSSRALHGRQSRRSDDDEMRLPWPA